MTNFSRNSLLVLGQHLEHHRGMQQQFVTNQEHRLKVIIRTYHTLGQWLRDVHTQTCENHTDTLHDNRHTLEDGIKLIAKSMALRLIHGSEHTSDRLALGIRQIEVATMLRFAHPSITLTEFVAQLLVQGDFLRNSLFFCI